METFLATIAYLTLLEWIGLGCLIVTLWVWTMR